MTTWGEAHAEHAALLLLTGAPRDEAPYFWLFRELSGSAGSEGGFAACRERLVKRRRGRGRARVHARTLDKPELERAGNHNETRSAARAAGLVAALG